MSDQNRPGPTPPYDIVSDPRIPPGHYLFVPKGADVEDIIGSVHHQMAINGDAFMVLDYEEPMPEPSPDFLWQARYADAAWDAFQHTDPFPVDDHGCTVAHPFISLSWADIQDQALSELLRELGIE